MSLCRACRSKLDIITGDSASKKLAWGNFADTVGHDEAHRVIIKLWRDNYGGQEKIDQFIASFA